MDYDETVEALQTILEVPINDEDENFLRIVPRAFEYASNRIHRDLRSVFPIRKTTTTLTAGNREVLVPQAVVNVQAMNVLSLTGRRSNLESVSTEALDIFWPDPTQTAFPDKYAIIGNDSLANPFIVRLMPTPDQAYPAEFIGPVRPPPLSQTNTQTYLSVVFPELHLIAAAVYMAGYQRDFQQAAAGYDGQYTRLLTSALIESRGQHAAADWYMPPDLTPSPPPTSGGPQRPGA